MTKLTSCSSVILWLFLCFSNPSKADIFVSERIIESLEVIESFLGAPVDFKYNETRSANGGLVSAPGCPKSIDGYPWIYRFHRISPFKLELRCHLLGTQGPCPVGRILFLQAGTKYGVCGCECLLYEPIVETKSSKIGYENKTQRLKLCYTINVLKGQAYDILDKSVCYNVGDRGPCENGKVLAIPVVSDWTSTPNKDLVCLPKCDVNDEDWFTKNINGDCTALGFGGAGGAANNLSPNDCRNDEKFSSVLRKCVKQNPKMYHVIG